MESRKIIKIIEKNNNRCTYKLYKILIEVSGWPRALFGRRSWVESQVAKDKIVFKPKQYFTAQSPSKYETQHDKTNKMTCALSEDSFGICPVWTVFAVRMKKHWVLSYPLIAQWRLWSDWADGYPGWSESSLGAQINLLVLSWAANIFSMALKNVPKSYYIHYYNCSWFIHYMSCITQSVYETCDHFGELTGSRFGRRTRSHMKFCKSTSSFAKVHVRFANFKSILHVPWLPELPNSSKNEKLSANSSQKYLGVYSVF